MILVRCPFRWSAVVACLLSFATALVARDLKSPDGQVVVHFELATVDRLPGCPVYRVDYAGHAVLGQSRLGLELEAGSLADGFVIAAEHDRTRDTRWTPVAAERDSIRDHFNELAIELEQPATGRKLEVLVRAYDEGVAFCYRLQGDGEFVITRERTQFAFTGDHTAWAVYRAQGNYDPADTRKQPKGMTTGPVALSALKAGVERPLTVRVTDSLYAAITEARLVDYARMKLRRAEGAATTLEPFLDAERGVYGRVSGRAPFTTPWRVLMLAESPGQLLEQDYLVLNLNEPCAIADTSWIKPGKVIREATLTTAGGKACVDFAVAHGLQYIEYDAGWYGAETDPASDARDVHLDPKRNPVPDSLNLREVIRYANAKGIGVILYVNHIALEKQIDEILPRYAAWGVKGVKYGFVNVGSQRWTAWLHEAIRKAAAHHLMVDVHDEFRSTGYQRTFPNLMTVEGVAGNEEFPTPVHNATLPFTRFLTGPADYTYCWNDPRLKVTKAHQLALSTINFSPWQFLYWYAKPSGVPEEPALEYWKMLPTTWDETRVIEGEIGERVVVARRKGRDWFIGAIAPVRGRFPLRLNFLSAGTTYATKIYADGADDPTVAITEKVVDAQATLEVDIRPNGGVALWLTPTR